MTGSALSPLRPLESSETMFSPGTPFTAHKRAAITYGLVSKRNRNRRQVRACILLRPRGQGARGPSVPQRAAPSEGGHSKCKWHVARVVRARALRSIGGRRRTGHPRHAPSAAAASSAPTPDPPACWRCERPRVSWLRR